MRARRPRSRVGLARDLVAVGRFPFTVSRLRGVADPPLQGSIANCQVECGRDARAPGWGLGRDLVAVGRLPFTVTRLRGMANPPLQGSLQIARSYAGGTPALPGGFRSEAFCCGWADVHGHFLVPGRMRAGRPRSRVGSLGRELVAASRFPFTASALQGAPSPLLGIDLQPGLKPMGGNPSGRSGIGLPDSMEKEHLVVLPLPPVIRPGGRGKWFLPETDSLCRPINRAGCVPGRVGGARP